MKYMRSSQSAAQILVAVVVTTICVISISTLVDAYYLSQERMRDLKKDLGRQSDILAHGLAYPLWNLGREEIAMILRHEIENPDVNAILVFDESGRLMTGIQKLANDSVQPADSAFAAQSRPVIFATRDITYKSKLIGYVALHATDKHLRETFYQELIGMLYKLSCCSRSD